MGIMYPVVWLGTVNVLLFCTTRRILPAQSVLPGWRGLLSRLGFTASNPASQDVENSVSCRGDEGSDSEKESEEDESTQWSQLDPLDGSHGSQVRIKIDNHVDNALQYGENREDVSSTNRSAVPGLPPLVPLRALPTLVSEEGRKSMASDMSERTVVGEEQLKKE